MPNTPNQFSDVRQIVQFLRANVRWWLLPAVVIAVSTLVYAVVRPATWEASQAIIVRNEAAGGERAPGKFGNPDEMKTIQETILEVAKSRGVLRAALVEVGPPADCPDAAAWPTERDIVETREDIALSPPKGAEFGKTEVFYLNVQSKDRARSVALNEAIFTQLRTQCQALRDAKARSMTDELAKAVHLAKHDLDHATAALQATELSVGSDLAELRSMQEVTTGDSALRRSAEEIRAQLRKNATTEKTNRALFDVLAAAQRNPGRFMATPNRLLESHPSLKRLKDGLVDAQLRTSTLMGRMSAEHPLVQAAKESEIEIGRNLHDELAIARQGVEAELRMLADRRVLLESQLAATDRRLTNLASVRASYANQAAEVENRTTLLERAEQNLADARATLASAKAASLISRIDAPDAGIYPIGPSRTMIALSGIVGGLLTGFGIVFFVLPGAAQPSAGSNGHASVAAGNGLFKPTFRPGARLSVKQALQKLA